MTDPRVNALCELLTNEIKQIAFYMVKISEFKITNEEIISKCIDALCVDFSNINFSEKDFIKIYQSFENYKKEVGKIYNNIHENSSLPYETITNPFEEDLKNSIVRMIKKGQKLLKTNHLFVSEETEQLFELISVLIKDTARNVSKIKDFDKNYTKYDFEILRFLNITNFPTTRVEKLKRRIKEFIEINYQTRRDFQKILEKNYGPKTKTKVNLEQNNGKSILVSGDNFKELELILKAVKDKNINIYTHDMLFIAHSYAKFKDYEALRGHFGTNNPRFDFSNFKGVIYVTKNYEQRIDSIVKANIFTTNPIMPKGISKIENNDFEPLIKSAIASDGLTKKNIKNNYIKVPYNKDKIILAEKSDRKIKIIVGAGSEEDENDNNLVINIFSPSEISLIYDICELNNKIESIIFSNCYLHNLILAFILRVKFDVKVHFAKCPNYYVNPNLIKCLKNEYEIEFS